MLWGQKIKVYTDHQNLVREAASTADEASIEAETVATLASTSGEAVTEAVSMADEASTVEETCICGQRRIHGRRGGGRCHTRVPVDKAVAEAASMADKAVATFASTTDEASTADEAIATLESTADKAVAEIASMTDEASMADEAMALYRLKMGGDSAGTRTC